MSNPAGGPRVLSIDGLRGLDVILMLFVNELAGVPGAPAFLLHTPPHDDGMTITDIVFPAFLFITGMALPFALDGRRRRGDALSAIWRHVLVRWAGLLLLGVLMVNADHAANGLLPAPAWNILMTVAAVLAWHGRPRDASAQVSDRWRWLGIALLVVAAFLYRAEGGVGLVQMRPQWWGILGLIGWAYLVTASLYLWAGERPAVLVAAIALLYCLYFADEAGRASWLVALNPIVNVGRNLGAHAAVTLSGTLLSVMLARHQRDGRSPRSFLAPALGYAAALGVAGLLLHTLHAAHSAFWINKILATPPWCLLSSAFTVVAWVAVYASTDARVGSRPPRLLLVAGENALLAYLLAPLLLSLFELCASLLGGTNPYEALAQPVWLGILRSALFTLLVVRLCGIMRRHGVRLQL